MYVGRALYLKGSGARLMMTAVWSGFLSLNTVSQQDNTCCYLENIIKSATYLSTSGKDFCLSACVVAILVSCFDFQSRLIFVSVIP